MEERMEQKGRLKNKTSAPVIGSKIKRDKLAEQFKQMKISRLKLMDKQHATLGKLFTRYNENRVHEGTKRGWW